MIVVMVVLPTTPLARVHFSKFVRHPNIIVLVQEEPSAIHPRRREDGDDGAGAFIEPARNTKSSREFRYTAADPIMASAFN